ncbi:hypothetical protein V5799_023993 [Amblyomma americanum]|uniref:Uncharacterized protein n=1 Tax=Amblyomma americanum TaxID=6943 RepID=A0AAQ4EDX4_AMBAM
MPREGPALARPASSAQEARVRRRPLCAGRGQAGPCGAVAQRARVRGLYPQRHSHRRPAHFARVSLLLCPAERGHECQEVIPVATECGTSGYSAAGTDVGFHHNFLLVSQPPHHVSGVIRAHFQFQYAWLHLSATAVAKPDGGHQGAPVGDLNDPLPQPHSFADESGVGRTRMMHRHLYWLGPRHQRYVSSRVFTASNQRGRCLGIHGGARVVSARLSLTGNTSPASVKRSSQYPKTRPIWHNSEVPRSSLSFPSLELTEKSVCNAMVVPPAAARVLRSLLLPPIQESINVPLFRRKRHRKRQPESAVHRKNLQQATAWQGRRRQREQFRAAFALSTARHGYVRLYTTGVLVGKPQAARVTTPSTGTPLLNGKENEDASIGRKAKVSGCRPCDVPNLRRPVTGGEPILLELLLKGFRRVAIVRLEFRDSDCDRTAWECAEKLAFLQKKSGGRLKSFPRERA